MIITQVHFVLGTIKGHSKMWSFVTQQCHRCLKLRECAIGILTAGMSTRAVTRKCKEMCPATWGKWWSNQILTIFFIHAPTFFLRYLWPTDAYLYSQSCEIHRLGPNECIVIDWFPYINCNSIKSFKLLHVAFIFLLIVEFLAIQCSLKIDGQCALQ